MNLRSRRILRLTTNTLLSFVIVGAALYASLYVGAQRPRGQACEIGPLLVLHRQLADPAVGRERDTHGPISNSDRRSGGATTILQPSTKDSRDRSDANFGSKQPSNDVQPADVSSATSASHVYRHQSVWRTTVHGR